MNASSAAPQSTFVSVLAWIVLILNGFGVLMAAMQNIMVNLLMPTMMTKTPNAQAAAFGLTAFRIFAICFLILAIFMTYCAYALLKRRNWARVAFIVICSFGIAWSVLGMLMFALGFGFGRMPTSGPQALPPDMKAAFTAILVVTSIMGVGMAVLLGWIIKRLRSPQIRAEFGRGDVVP